MERLCRGFFESMLSSSRLDVEDIERVKRLVKMRVSNMEQATLDRLFTVLKV